MKQFTLNLVKDMQRPIVTLKNWNNFRALLDTGAYFPIWTDDEKLLEALGGVRKKTGVHFGGFGGKTKGNLYVLPSVLVGDLAFPSMHIIACNDLKETPFQMILSATMFDGLIYEINTKTHKLNVTVLNGESNIRNLRIEDANDHLHILCSSDGVCETE